MYFMVKVIRRVAPLIVTLVLFSGAKAYAAANPSYFYDGSWHEYTEAPVYLKVNGETVTTDMPPILFNDSTLVPARSVFEKMGANVTWDEANKKVIVNLGSDKIELNIDSTYSLVNGQGKTMPIPAKIINDRTMIPIRFVSETLGNKVIWDESQRLVDVEAPVNIKSITSAIMGNKLRITVAADKSLFEINNYILNKTDQSSDRIVLDLQNTVILPATQNLIVPQNSTVTGIRAAQNTVKPYLTRVVADLSAPSVYSVSTSDDKKCVYIDIDMGGTEIGNPQVNYGTGSIDVKLPIGQDSQYYLYSMGEKGIFYMDIPKAKFNTLPSVLQPTDTSLIKKIEYIQDNDTARLKVYSDKPVLTKVVKENGTMTLRLLTPGAGNVEYSNNNGVPRITLKSDIVTYNYYRYAYWNDGNTFIVRSYSNLGAIPDSKLFINDGIINTVVFEPDGGYGTLYYIQPNTKTDFRINTVSKANAMYIEPSVQRTSAGQDIAVTDSMKNKLIVIDPGHGGSDPGAVVKDSNGNNVAEKDLNLDISQKLYNMLKDAGFNVKLTRTNDTFVGLYDRATFANDNNAALFVSVHNNFLPSGGSGTMNFFYPSLPQSTYGIPSERVAQIAQEETVRQLGSVDLGIWKRPWLAVLNGINMPGILSEIGCMNDPAELSKLQDPAYRTKAAASLFSVIKRSLYEMDFKDYANAMTPQPAVNRTDVDTSKPLTVNGFTLPALKTSKCAYNWKDITNSSSFDLSIMLDYSKEVNKTATLDEQRKEAIQVLSTRLDTETVNKIADAISRQGDYSSHIYTEELGNDQYTIWVRCFKTTGVCSIDIKKK